MTPEERRERLEKLDRKLAELKTTLDGTSQLQQKQIEDHREWYDEMKKKLTKLEADAARMSQRIKEMRDRQQEQLDDEDVDGDGA